MSRALDAAALRAQRDAVNDCIMRNLRMQQTLEGAFVTSIEYGLEGQHVVLRVDGTILMDALADALIEQFAGA